MGAEDSVAPRRHQIFWSWFKGFVLAAIFILVDPFGCSERADRGAERLIHAVAAPWLAPHGEDRPGQRAITVVIVDDAFIEAYRKQSGNRSASWPIPREEQFYTIIEPILSRAPHAVFLDWVYHSEDVASGDNLPALQEGFRSMFCLDERLQNTRVIFGDRPPPATEDRAGCATRLTTSERLRWNSHMAESMLSVFQPPPQSATCPLGGRAPEQHWAERASIRHWGREDRYPLAPLALADGRNAAVRSRDDECAPFADREALIPSAAYALFAHWCRTDEAAKDHRLCAQPSFQSVLAHDDGMGRTLSLGYHLHRWPDEVSRNLAAASAPQWLWYQSSNMRNLRGQLAEQDQQREAADRALAARGKASFDPGAYDRVCQLKDQKGRFAASFEALRPRFGRPEDRVGHNRCLGIDTISASDLQTVGGGLNDAWLTELLHNRLVLVGADTDASPDRASSPVNGTVPAVLVHAAVLENLISDGEDRSREAPDFLFGIPGGVLASIGLAAIAAIPLAPMVHASLARRSGRGGWASHWLARSTLVILALILGLFLPFLLGLAMHRWTNWAPANWISPLAANLVMVGGGLAALAFAFPRVAEWSQAQQDRLYGHYCSLRSRIPPQLRKLAALAVALAIILSALLVAAMLS